MIKINDKSLCSGCTACKSICPRNCIVMEEDEEGFLYPAINAKKCINCGACDKVCPIKNTHFHKKDGFPDGYLVYDSNSKWRENSAAGGGFAAIARYFIEKYHGVVFGAVYDENYRVFHTFCETTKDLYRIQKSKYVQSDLGESFANVKGFLQQNRYVLFSGTPCQIYGLKSFLKVLANSDLLYCIDLSCHGVPSPKVLKIYLQFQEQLENSKISSFKMRGKELKNSSYNQGFDIQFENGKHKFLSHSESYYGRCFWGEISSRPSCYNCHFKTVWRSADITLGDCWFLECFVPKKKDTMGVTMALTHTKKGNEMLNTVRELTKYKIDSEQLIKANGGMIYLSAQKNPNRDEFFRRLDYEDFDKLAESYFPLKNKSKKQIVIDKIDDLGFGLSSLKRINKKRKLSSRLRRTIPESCLGEMN